MARFSFLDHPGPIPFAHRGGASDAPENTMPAFQRAVELGYRYVETDVHVTADGVAVAFHDAELDRVTDRRGPIADLPWSEVAKAVVGGEAGVPRLDDLLGTWPDLRVNLDPKSDRATAPMVEVIERTGSLHRVCVGSFSGRRVRESQKRLGPELCTGMGPVQVARLVAAGVRLPAGRFSAAAAQIPARAGPLPVVTRGLVRAAHRHGVHVHVWTIDDADEMHRLLDLGVDGIMTDRPAVLREVLESRGQWVS